MKLRGRIKTTSNPSLEEKKIYFYREKYNQNRDERELFNGTPITFRNYVATNKDLLKLLSEHFYINISFAETARKLLITNGIAVTDTNLFQMESELRKNWTRNQQQKTKIATAVHDAVLDVQIPYQF